MNKNLTLTQLIARKAVSLFLTPGEMVYVGHTVPLDEGPRRVFMTFLNEDEGVQARITVVPDASNPRCFGSITNEVEVIITISKSTVDGLHFQVRRLTGCMGPNTTPTFG